MSATALPVAVPVPEGAAPPAPRGKARLVIVAGLVLVLLGGGGAGAWWMFLRGRTPRPPVAAPKAEAAVQATVSLGAVVINVQGEPKRFLRAAMSLGLASAKDAKVVDERKAELLDLLIAVLSTTEIAVLTSGEGRAELKDTLLERIHAEVGLPTVARIYFTEFVLR
jgi:flagellar FliL protein